MRLKTVAIIIVLLASMVLMALPFGEAIVYSNTYYVNLPYNQLGTYSPIFQYGYSFTWVPMGMNIPTGNSFALSFWLMNSSNTGYDITFSEVSGVKTVAYAPIVNNVVGAGGSTTVSTWNGLIVNFNYNYTTNYFRFDIGGIVVFSGTVGINLVVSNYRVLSSAYQSSNHGSIVINAMGFDNAGQTYDNPIYNGVDFVSYTDGIASESGGTINWTSGDFLNPAKGTGGNGYNSSFSQMDQINVQANPATGYTFDSWYIGTDYTGRTFYPAGYYDPGGRLIASANLYHLYPSETGEIIHHTTWDISGAVWTALVSQLSTGLMGANFQGLAQANPGWYWHNSTGYYPLWELTGPIVEQTATWNLWIALSPVRPSYAGVVMGNPTIFQYTTGNYTVVAQFISTNYSPANVNSGTATPTPNPSGSPFNFNFSFAGANSNLVAIAVYMIAMFLTSIGIVILLKAPGAWFVAVPMVVIGMFMAIATWTSLWSLAGWSITIVSTAFLSHNNFRDRSK